MMPWQVTRTRDGNLELFHEDYLHGDDVALVMTPDGHCLLRTYQDDPSEPDGLRTVYTPVNLADALAEAFDAWQRAQHEERP